MPNNILSIETKAGKPVIVGSTRVIPFARVLCIQFPGIHGGIIWNRPVSVLAATADGQEHVLPVSDVTRETQLKILGAGLVGSILIWFLFRMFWNKE